MKSFNMNRVPAILFAIIVAPLLFAPAAALAEETGSTDSTAGPPPQSAAPPGSEKKEEKTQKETGSTNNAGGSPPQAAEKNGQQGAAPPAPAPQSASPAAAAPAASEKKEEKAQKETGSTNNAGGSPPQAAEKNGQQGAAPPAPAPQSASKAAGALEASEEEKQKAEKQKQAAAQEAASDVVGMISGKFEFDVTEAYTHMSTEQLFINGFGILPVLVVGNVTVENVRRDFFTTIMEANYRLTDKLTVGMQVPVTFAIARTSTATGITGNNVANASSAGENVTHTADLGDIGTSLTYQLLSEGLTRPSVYGGLGFKARNGRDLFATPDPAADPPVGTGFYSLRGSVSASKSTAPAVVFGSLSYAYAFSRQNVLYEPLGHPAALLNYEPGANISWSAGVALSLNYQLSLNFGFAQAVNLVSKINNHSLANSDTDAITFRMGGIWRLSDRTSIDLSGTIGLSPDAPDFTLALRLPFRY
jgi:hypothetical protein